MRTMVAVTARSFFVPLLTEVEDSPSPTFKSEIKELVSNMDAQDPKQRWSLEQVSVHACTQSRMHTHTHTYTRTRTHAGH